MSAPTGISTIPPRVAVLGDIDRGNRTIALGDSIILGGGDNANGYLGPTSFFTLGCILSFQRILHSRNAGVAGETAAQVLARVSSDVIAYRPAKCIVQAGANDVGGGFSLSAYAATMTSIYNQLRSAGIEPIVCSLTPRAGSPTGANTMKANLWLKRYAEAQGLKFVDLYTPLVDPTTGGFAAGNSGDGLHLTSVGARIAGQALADQLAPLYPPLKPFGALWDTDPTNLLAGGCFAVDTNADGISNSWTVTGAGGTFTYTRPTTPALLGNWQQIAVSGAAQRFFSQSIASGWSVGDRLAFSGRISTTLEAGSMGAYVIIAFTGGSPARYAPLFNCAVDIADGRFYYEGVVPASTSAISVQVYNTGTGTGTIKVGEVSVVNLTTQGLA